MNLHEIIQVDDQLSIQAFYAGHVLGAAMFLVKVGEESVRKKSNIQISYVNRFYIPEISI